MAESNEQDEQDEVNYYAVLNVSREASIEDIKSSYRRLCKLYHPDRHVDPAKKEQAIKLFNQLQKGYEVLSDQDKRAIYDLYGQKGLDADWQVIARQRTQAEIQEEYERLQRQKDEERLLRRTNPKVVQVLAKVAQSETICPDQTRRKSPHVVASSQPLMLGKEEVETFDDFSSFDQGLYVLYKQAIAVFVIGVDGTDLFEPYEEREFPNVEVTKMTINQSIEAPLTLNDTLRLSGNLSVQNGNGNGHVSAAWRRVLSAFSWAEVECAAGNGPLLQLRAFRNLTQSSYGNLGFVFHKQHRGIGTAFHATLARQLGSQATGYITWKAGLGSSMETSIVKENDNSRLQLGLQLGVQDSFVSCTYRYKIDVDTTLRTGMKLGLVESQFSYGVSRKISEHSILGASMTVGSASGVILKIRLNRANQTFIFPLYLSESVSPMAIFYGTIAPLLLYYSVNTLLVKPFLAKAKERESKEKQDKFAERLAKMKRNAEEYIELMRSSYETCVECEQRRHGLIIVNAWYGNICSFNEEDINNPYRVSKVIDVTIALQCQVKDSKLFLTEGSKAQMNGFYDPCIGEAKSLRVRYLFRDSLHEVTIDEIEALAIPRQSHRRHSMSATT